MFHSDIFLFGGRRVYRNFFSSKKYVEAFDANDVARDILSKEPGCTCGDNRYSFE